MCRRCSKCRARAARRPSWRIPGFRARLAKVRAATQVDYAAVASLKMPVLQAAFERFRDEHLARHTARAAACRAFLRERGEPMRLHTLFDAIDGYLRRHHGTGGGLAQLAGGVSPSGQRRGAPLRRDARRRGGLSRLPAMAGGRAAGAVRAAGARAVAQRRPVRRLRRGRERLGLRDLVRPVAVLHRRGDRRAARSHRRRRPGVGHSAAGSARAQARRPTRRSWR